MKTNNDLIERLPAKYRHLVRPATVADAIELAPRVRAADRQEIKAHSGMNMEMALRLGIQRSIMAWAFLHPDTERVHVIAGLNLHPNPNPWASGAPFDYATSRFFASVRRIVINYMFEFTNRMVNAVDARNSGALNWLKREGFKISGPYVFGPEKRYFYWFTGEKEDFQHV